MDGGPRAALAAATENWKSPREPRDAGALLEAALATARLVEGMFDLRRLPG